MDNQRYIIDFDLKKITKEYFDVLIIGSGIAGIYTALEIPPACNVAILTKETIDISNSVLAQGGIAVSLDDEDSPKLHFKDTLYAGAGLCNEKSVWILVNEAADNIKTLFKYGVNFDRNKSKKLSFSREAAHSKNRIIHAGDTTGKEVCDKLTGVAWTRKNIFIKERNYAIDVITEDGCCKGVIAYNEDDGEYKAYLSDIVICATGGYGQIYENTTNPEVSTGDGVCMAYRAGADLMDLEFVQFHPTVLQHPQNRSFLISEAVRGDGGILKNINGERFMPAYHELGELAPRDVVSRAIFSELKNTDSDHVFLDITFKDEQYLRNRFPNIYKTCLSYGIDITKDYIPVSPAEHYCMGGIKTDVYGRTGIRGLYACGEVACNGIHGANRLASNSLLEGLVFGRKIGEEVTLLISKISEEYRHKVDKLDVKEYFVSENGNYYIDLNMKVETNRKAKEGIEPNDIIKSLKRIMTDNVGILRDEKGLTEALNIINEYYDIANDYKPTSLNDIKLINMITISKRVIQSCIKRKESRGAHYRSDYTNTDDAWRRNIVINKETEI